MSKNKMYICECEYEYCIGIHTKNNDKEKGEQLCIDEIK